MTFTSDLTIDEVLLIEEIGFEPVDLVMGSTYYHTGWQFAPWSQNMELGDATRMMAWARRAAMQRLMEQVHQVGADGVVGMRLEIEREGHNAEFTAIGTAVRRRGNDREKWRTPKNQPFSSALSGVDFWALVRAGFRPISMVCGVCVYHVARQTLGGWFQTVNQNCEMPAFTQALYDARELAMERMQYEAQEAGGAAGVVGVSVEESSHGWDSHIIEFSALGTSILPIHDPEHEVHEMPKIVMGIQDL
jgi:uncharacterized protein YbjQ (UPF0145 family)